MNTSKPISTISWNSKKFLLDLLPQLVSSHIIDFWDLIYHKPEDDEGGNKHHFHIFLEPSKRISTADLRECFKEDDFRHPDKPLCCLTFRSSIFSDWYLYGLHDPSYLTAHNLSRKYSYQDKDFLYSDYDEHLFRIRSCDLSHYTPVSKLAALKKSGLTFEDCVIRGLVPIAQLKQYSEVYSFLPGRYDSED